LQAMFRGDLVNSTEHRAALHSWLRRPPAIANDVSREMARTQQAMFALAARIRAGDAAELGLIQPTDVIHLGIGGSDLGPRLLADALPADASLRVHFVSNVDAHALLRLLPQLDPRHTLVVVVSKSFGTQETLLNATTVRQWLQASGCNPAEHFLAVSSRPDLAAKLDIQPQFVFPMSDTVGGRYSLWSAASLSVVLRIGPAQFSALLAGAAAMDTHTEAAELSVNLPHLAAITGLVNRSVHAWASYAVVPYDERLKLFPAYLQQLEMESLGKSVRHDGRPVESPTAPVLLPGLGTDAQHAFFQALHQGTEIVPVDFIGVASPDHAYVEHHEVLLSHLLAQGAALLTGKSEQQAYAELSHLSDVALRTCMAKHRTFPGNRPSSLLMLPRLDAYSLGALIAMYEHKVYFQSLYWDINAFDQWGVELGKQIAGQLLPALRGAAIPDSVDPITASWIKRLQTR